MSETKDAESQEETKPDAEGTKSLCLLWVEKDSKNPPVLIKKYPLVVSDKLLIKLKRPALENLCADKGQIVLVPLSIKKEKQDLKSTK